MKSIRRETTIIIAGLAILGAVVGIWWQVKPPSPQFNRTPIIGVGQVVVDETVRILQGRGRLVVVLPAAAGANPPALPANGLWEAFRDELKKHSAISLAPPEFAASDQAGVPGFTVAAFKEIWERHGGMEALIFFNGLPVWDDVRDVVRQGGAPQVIVVDLDGPPLKRRYRDYFASGVLRVLIGLRSDPGAGSPSEPTTPRDWFHSRYQVYTPENYDSLAD